MFLSVFEIFKTGIGPSSSHTVGPMVAARRFIENLTDDGTLDAVNRVRVSLHGSLAFTGKGHGTDTAIILGLAGERPETVEPYDAAQIVADVRAHGWLCLGGDQKMSFSEAEDLLFDFGPPLPQHANGMRFSAFDRENGLILECTFFSTGGGFVSDADEMAGFATACTDQTNVPYGFHTAKEMLEMGAVAGMTIAEMKFANETAVTGEDDVRVSLDRIWQDMLDCMDRGLAGEGELPGGLHVKRRAKQIFQALEDNKDSNMRFEHTVMDRISMYAIAVNEENAAGGRIVTAPTNGAAGVVPATLRYYRDFCPGACDAGIHQFLLTAAAIGGLIKSNASISGAEVGCQGEVGSASAMAAAGLCAALGGSNSQIENAAEIALEHHLGMTCDPIGGLVQVPCIERNAMGAVKAVTAASLALKGDGTHIVPLDSAIETMRQTGMDMSSKYKETSQGGLAVNTVEC